MSKCAVCRNDRLVYKYTLRFPRWYDFFQSTFNRFVLACGADPRHDVDLLVYDVELPL